jgi:aldehyde dehydrogenase (NAD+)
VDRAAAAAHAAFESRVWRDTPPAERIALLRKFNTLREDNADRIAELITAENGSAAWFTRPSPSERVCSNLFPQTHRG